MGAQLSRDPYFNQKRASSVLFCVLLVHIGIIAIPLIYSSLTEYFDPPLIVMKVGLADLPLGDSPDAGAPADVPADTSAAEPDPVVSMDDIPNPQKVNDLPPDIPPPPKVENPPPKTDTKVPVEEPPPKQKTDTKPKVTPPKTDTKKDPPKTQTKQDPPKSNLLKPEDIIKPKNTTKTQAQIEAERRAREAAEARAKADAKARQDAIADIRAAAGTQQGRYGTTDPGQQGILATKEMRDYYEQLNAYIRPKWNAVSPSSVELSGKVANWPTIHLTIAKDGRITKAAIVNKSGNKAIDAAVETLLADLKVAPVPPQAATIPVTLEIR